jgi:hypothetical protein
MGSARFSEQITSISLNKLNQFDFAMETQDVFSDVRNEFLNII